MASITWFLVGLAVVALIFVVGLRLNRGRAAAQLAVRLAEAYRVRGDFETAHELYAVPGKLKQRVPEAIEGAARAFAEDRSPVIDPALIRAAMRSLEDDRDALRAFFAARGVELRLPALPSD